MCLLGIAFRQFSKTPLLVLANREEFYARPTAGPQLFPRQGEVPAWLGGIDLVAGGTWLGVNEFGLLVAVTNRKKNLLPENPPSRGLLCRNLMACRETASAVAVAVGELQANQYAGCNFLIADRESAFVIEAGNAVITTTLPPGLHLIANAELNAENDLRMRRVRNEFQRAKPATVDEWFHEARHVCQLPADGNEPPICLTGADRGTVSSTVLGIGKNLESSRYWYAPGPPNSTSYEDFTPLLRELLAVRQAFQPDADDIASVSGDIEPPYDSPARRAVRQSLTYGIKPRDTGSPAASPGKPSNAPYRILLRGPWQCEPLARAELDASGHLVWSDTALPGPATVRLPDAWQALFGQFRGRVRFRRRFHPPSNISAGDRLFILLNATRSTGAVSVNGQFLGRIENPTGIEKFDVTGMLRVNNELEIQLEFTEFGDAAPPGGLFTPIALEIYGS